MKSSYFHFLGCLLAAVLLLVSCDNGNTSPDGPTPPDPIVDPIPGEEEKDRDLVSKISVNGNDYLIQSAGYYYDEEFDGFEFMFSSEVIDLSHALYDLPEGTSFVIDIPARDMDNTHDLVYILNGESWKFFFTYVVDGKQIELLSGKEIFRGSIKSGKLFITEKDGVFEMNFQSELYSGDLVNCCYKGKPVQSDDFIYSWNL